MRDVGAVRLDVPYVGAADTDERNYTYGAFGIHAAERIAHIPHEVEVEIGHFGFAVGVVIPVKRAIVAAEAEAYIRGEPFAYADIICGGDMAFGIAGNKMVFNHRNGDTCAEL